MPLASKARAAALSSQTHASVEMSRIARWSCGVARARTRGGPRQGSLWPVRAAGRREIGDGLQAESTRHRATAARRKAPRRNVDMCDPLNFFMRRYSVANRAFID